MKSSLYKILATEQTERVCETPLVKDSGGSARDIVGCLPLARL